MNIIDEIYILLKIAISRLIERRLEEGYFNDEGGLIQGKAYFSTLEGLDALLIPLVNLPKTRLGSLILADYPDIKKIFYEDIGYILEHNLDIKQPNPDFGSPYFKDAKSKPYWTSECSSFTLSVLANYLELKNRFGLKLKLKVQDIHKVIKKNLDWVSTCKRGNAGWAWIFEQKEAHPWPTWSLLDTFNEFLEFKSTKDKYHKILHSDCESVINHILESFQSTDASSYGSTWKTKVLKKTEDELPYDIKTALDMSRLMLAASLYGTGKKALSGFPNELNG